MHYVILRDDETCAATAPAQLDRLYRPFLERRLPVNLAVIGDARELVAYLQGEPGYQVVQHG